MTAWLACLGHPEETFQVIHIAGTNGKGSCAWILANLLQKVATSQGLPPIGLTTSPHLTHWGERIWVGGHGMCYDAFQRLSWEVAEHLAPTVTDTESTPTAFEFLTLCAFYHFAQQGCAWVVLEVGLGGRLDATNAIPPAAWSLITSIGYDHMQVLGNTLPEIAREKAGILKAATPTHHTQGLVVGRSLLEASSNTPLGMAYEVIRTQAEERGIPLLPHPVYVTPQHFEFDVSRNLAHPDVLRHWQCHRHVYSKASDVSVSSHTFRSLHWLASYQAENIQSVLTLCHALAKTPFQPKTSSMTWETLGLWDAWHTCFYGENLHTQLPPWQGRCEWHPSYRAWIDGAHNPEGWRAFFSTLTTFNQDTQSLCDTLWMAIPANRRIEAFIEALYAEKLTPKHLILVTPTEEEQQALPVPYHDLNALKHLTHSEGMTLRISEGFQETVSKIQAWQPLVTQPETFCYQAVCGSLYWVASLYHDT
jgi:folylpolyglutamate synthase/dihydrofolate synthase